MKFRLLLLMGALPLMLAAQSPSERAMLSAWDDSLQQVSNAITISAYDGPSRQGSGRAGDLRRGLFLIRRGDLTDSRGDIELTLTNMQVMANHSKWAWPHYVMARAFDVLARKQWIEVLSDGKKLAETHSDAVWRTLRGALDIDESFPNARRMLAELAAAGGDRFLRPDQVVALQRESRRTDAGPDALLAWGRHLRTVEDYRNALTTFDRALDHGGDRSRLALERSRTLMALGDSAAAVTAYWDGADHLTSAGRQLYHYDLWWIAEPEELTAFDETPDFAVGARLRRFWNARDAEAANKSGERLAEHLRRWVVAFERYRALSPWTDAFWSRVEMKYDQIGCEDTDAKLFEQLWRHPPTTDDDLRGHEPILDHRGMLYLRHGEPTRIITDGFRGENAPRRRALTDPYTFAPRAKGPTGVLLPWSSRVVGEVPLTTEGPLRESWMYWWDGELHLVHFGGSLALGGYAPTTLSESMPGYLLYATAVASSLPIAEYYAMAKRIKWWTDSSVFGPSGPKYGPKDDPKCFDETRAAIRRTGRDENASINRDSDTPPNFRGWNSVGLAFGLGSAADQSSKLLATFAIPATALEADHLEGGSPMYTLDLRIVAYDKAHDRTITFDTTRFFAVDRPLVRGQFLIGYTELPLPSGLWQVAARASQINGSVVLQDVHTVRIDDSGLALSDIVTGRPGNPAWTATDDAPFPINYPNGWFGGEAAELFFEVRGVPVKESYHTTVEVRQEGSKSTAAVIQIQSTDAANDTVTRVRKTLGLNQLAPGKYTVTVTVEYQGKKAVRTREITIVAR